MKNIIRLLLLLLTNQLHSFNSSQRFNLNSHFHIRHKDARRQQEGLHFQMSEPAAIYD